jgi:histidinol-phosphatase
VNDAAVCLEAVTDLALRCGEIAMRYFGTGIDIDTKADGSPVTVADRATETFAREWITARFPGDGIIGEEFGTLNPTARRKWVIDPIDGTASFVRGVPLWGTLVAVMDGDTPVAGAVNCAALNEIASAAIGQGSWWQGRRASVSETSKLSEATILTTDETFRASPPCREPWVRLAKSVSFSRSWGDCYGYLLVATGRADVMVDGVLSLWDAAAVMPIVQEAGGVFTDWQGRATPSGGNAIATNRAIADSARSILSSPDA